MHRILSLLAVLAVCTPAFAANMLVNGSFSLPVDGTPACPTGGLHSIPDAWVKDTTWSTGDVLSRNGSVYTPTCPNPFVPSGEEDLTYAYWSNGGAGKIRYYQEITLPQPTQGEAYKFTGYYAGGTSMNDIQVLYGIRVGDHTQITAANQGNMEKILYKWVYQGQSVNWTAFTVTLTPPVGTTQMTVYFQAEVTGPCCYFKAMWWDYFKFDLASDCANNPDITGVNPAAIEADGTQKTLTLTGTDFANVLPMVCKLRAPNMGTEYTADSITVDSSTQVTVKFTLPTNAAYGEYDLIYNQDNCEAVTKTGAVLVYLSQLRNGDFETPGAATICTAENTHPTDWAALQLGSFGWSPVMVMNGWVGSGPMSVLPTCPRGSEGNYATNSENDDKGGVEVFQSIAADPNTQYTLSGLFAASGDTISRMELREGGRTGTLLASMTLTNGPTLYDWQFKYATGTTSASAEYMTVVWHCEGPGNNVQGQRGIHADNLAVEACNDATPPLITGVTPTAGVNDQVVHATLQGSNYDGSEQVFLMKPGVVVAGTVTGLQGSDLKVDFDLTAMPAPSGSYDVLVKSGGCITSLPAGFKVAAVSLINGSMEDPPAGDPCQGRKAGMPTGWNTNNFAMFRDDQAPNPIGGCPSPDGGHYASFSEGGGGTVQAWQTLKTVPGHQYEFRGYLDAPAGVTVTLRLVDGYGTSGTEVAAQTVDASAGWVWGVVSGTAISNATTAVWQMNLPGGSNPGGHADGLEFEDVSGCNDPFADFDGDGDVDAEDWGVMQACITGQGNGVPSGCTCANKVVSAPSPEGVDQSDVAAFEACASGPNVNADPDCDGVD